jgi:hypothetical protein
MNATWKSNHRRVTTLRGFRISKLVLGVALAGLYTVTLSAAPILNGTFNIAGNITVSNPGFNGCVVAVGCITWSNPPATLANRADIAATGLSGVFTDPLFPGNDAAILVGLINPPEIVGGPIVPAMPYMTWTDPNFAGAGFLLNFIPNGIFPPVQCSTNVAAAAVGQVCTVPGSLFNFVNNPGLQATATWVLQGVSIDGKSTWQGNFTAQFGVPFQQVLLDLQNNGSVTNTYSATFTATSVPEPGPLVLSACGLGLLLFSAGLRRKFGRSN